MVASGIACAFLGLGLLHAAAAVKVNTVSLNPNPAKFLIVSAPGEGKVSYLRIESSADRTVRSGGGRFMMKTLIDRGLIHPQGLAVDQKARKLYVADPDSRRILSYALHGDKDGLSVGSPNVLVEGVEARWIAVDDTGSAFFSNEQRNQIVKVPNAGAVRGNATTKVVYDGASMLQVSAPGGVAIDSFHTFWVNKQVGSQAASVVRAANSLAESSTAAAEPLAKNLGKSYGICIATNNLYFTQPETTVYGIRTNGGEVVPVSDSFTNPRGCVFDGDGTVYVADRGANAIYSFAGNMQELSAVQISKVVDFKDAYGTAIFSNAVVPRSRKASFSAANPRSTMRRLAAIAGLLTWQLCTRFVQ